MASLLQDRNQELDKARKESESQRNAAEVASQAAKQALARVTMDLYKQNLRLASQELHSRHRATARQLVEICQGKEFDTVRGWELDYLRHRSTSEPFQADIGNSRHPVVQFHDNGSIMSLKYGFDGHKGFEVYRTADWQRMPFEFSEIVSMRYLSRQAKASVGMARDRPSRPATHLELFAKDEQYGWRDLGALPNEKESLSWRFRGGCFDAKDERFAAVMLRDSQHFSVSIWDLKTRSIIASSQDHEQEKAHILAYDLRINSANDRLYLRYGPRDISLRDDNVVTALNRVIALDLATGEQIELVPGRKLIAMDEQGRRCVIEGDPAMLYDVSSKREVCPLPAGSGIYSFSDDGSRLVRWTVDGQIEAWNTETGVSLGKGSLPGQRLDGIAVTPDGHRLIANPGDHTLLVWDTTERLQQVFFIQEEFGSISSLQFDPQGRLLAVADDTAVTLLDGTPQ